MNPALLGEWDQSIKERRWLRQLTGELSKNQAALVAAPSIGRHILEGDLINGNEVTGRNGKERGGTGRNGEERGGGKR